MTKEDTASDSSPKPINAGGSRAKKLSLPRRYNGTYRLVSVASRNS